LSIQASFQTEQVIGGILDVVLMATPPLANTPCTSTFCIMPDPTRSPILLCIGGHDPSGGAGIQADIEAARAAGIHAATVVTCLTAQDTRGLRGFWPQPPKRVEAQCRLILHDSQVGAIKIGMIGSSPLARWLCQLADDYPSIPIVLDPILASGAGQRVTDSALFNQLRSHLLGRCLLATPNLPEAQALGNAQNPDDCARNILATGCRWVLITGTHAESHDVVNRLYGADGSRQEWSLKRLPQIYHGSGCTLTSAIAARLVLGIPLSQAIAAAQHYTWLSLEAATSTGLGQWTPNRLYALPVRSRPEP
jgi:hydroxymethylpyrimidine/phosphomethylpyrimidine kinase